VWPLIIDIIRKYAAQDGAIEKERDQQIASKIAKWTKITGIGTVIAAILAAVAAGIFGLQLRTMQAQLAEQQVDFRLDQRPILALADIFPGPEFAAPGISYVSANNALGWNYGVKNYGKGTAFSIRMFEYVSVLSSHFRGHGGGRGRVNSDLVPTQAFWSTSVFDGPIIPEIEAKAAATDAGIIMKAIIKYCDVYKTLYTTPICLRHFANGATGNCLLSEIANIPTDGEDYEKNSIECPDY
jgi:hypothetical protein